MAIFNHTTVSASHSPFSSLSVLARACGQLIFTQQDLGAPGAPGASLFAFYSPVAAVAFMQLVPAAVNQCQVLCSAPCGRTEVAVFYTC